MTDRAQRYIDSVPGASKGGRNNALNTAAYNLRRAHPDLTPAEVLRLMESWNARCSPPLSDTELQRTVESVCAAHVTGSERKVRFVVGSGSQPTAPRRAVHVFMDRSEPPSDPQAVHAQTYTPGPDTKLPGPLPDAAATYLREMFRAGEFVWIEGGAIREGRETPCGKGHLRERDEWLLMIIQAGGVDALDLPGRDPACGVYVCINPLLDPALHEPEHRNRRLRANISDYRHCLLEWDDVPLANQWAAIEQSRVPCTAVVHSGGKSIHGLVRIDAGTDDDERTRRVGHLYDHFGGTNLDKANKDATRLSRLPGVDRGFERQELLAIHLGRESWDRWVNPLKGRLLGDFRISPPNAPDELIRDRFLCHGGAAMLAGPTGAGKSSLMSQFSIAFAIGRPMFGLEPTRPHRVLMFQAENDDHEIAYMRNGIYEGLKLDASDRSTANRGVMVVSEDMQTGKPFIDGALKKHAESFRPDIVILDPLLAFVGCNASAAEEVGVFLRQWIAPLARGMRFGLIVGHHISKPLRGNQKGRVTDLDELYDFFGSVEIINWCRGGLKLTGQAPGHYKLTAPKRGGRLGWPAPAKYIRHGETMSDVCWYEYEHEESAKVDNESVTSKLLVRMPPGKKEKRKVVMTWGKNEGVTKVLWEDAVERAVEKGWLRQETETVNGGKMKWLTRVNPVETEGT